MPELQKDFTVEVAGDGGEKRNVDVKMIEDQNWNLTLHAEHKLAPIGDYSVSCTTGIDCGFGVRRVIVTTPDERQLTAQFNSWQAAVGTDVRNCPDDIKVADAVAQTLIKKLECN